MLKKYMPYLISVFISLGIGGFSAFLTKNNMDLYSEINRPALSPPSWLFPVVWTILFVLMGIAAALVWCSNGKKIDSSLIFTVSSLFSTFAGASYFSTSGRFCLL